MLQLRNATPFAATVALLPDAAGIDTVYAIVKGTFTIGDRFGLGDEQLPIVPMDIYRGDPTTSSLRLCSDVCLGKPATDVILLGSAWAPGGRPTWQMDVSVSVGPVSNTVRVFGDRVWDTSSGVASMTWLTPFERMPLVWERAFGGTGVTDAGPRVYSRNPAGTGYRASDSVVSAAGLALPNIEDPRALISTWSDTPNPVAFGPVAPHWEPRRSYAGTYDAAWQMQRAPYLPDDFDPRFFQCAPVGLIAPGHLRGGEIVDIRGATPDSVLRFQLPAARVGARFRFDTSSEMRPATLETVVIEPDDHRLVMVWRAALRCDKRALRVREVETKLLDA